MSMSMLSTYALTTHESEAMTPPTNIHTLQLNVAMTTLARGPEKIQYLNNKRTSFHKKLGLRLSYIKEVFWISQFLSKGEGGSEGLQNSVLVRDASDLWLFSCYFMHEVVIPGPYTIYSISLG